MREERFRWTAGGGGADRCLVVVVNGHECAIPLESIMEIRGLESLEPTEDARGQVVGTVAVRGQTVDVLDPGRLFGRDRERQALQGSLVLLTERERRVVLLVDRALEIGVATPRPMGAPQHVAPVDSAVVLDTVTVAGRPLPLLDIRKLVSTLEAG